MTPMRANIFGPPNVATSMRAPIAACHSSRPIPPSATSSHRLQHHRASQARGRLEARSVRRNATAILCQASMTPALFVEFGFKAFRHPRCCIFVARVAPWTRSSGAATGAGVLAFPWSIRMGFTKPAAVLAKWALHQANRSAPAWVNFT
jgi:hypothetical protein